MLFFAQNYFWSWFWMYQTGALVRWGLAVLVHGFFFKNAPFHFKKSRNSTQTLVLILPGVGGKYTQFYWMICSVIQHCAVDILYVQPKAGQSLEQNTQEILELLQTYQWLDYSGYIAIGHSRGGLLAKSILDVFPPSKMRILCTLATPWKAPDAMQHSGIRGWVAQKRYYAELSRLYSWSYEGTIELFRTYHASSYETYALASLYDPIVGDPFYQCPYERPTAYQMSTHLSIPLDHPAIAYIVNLIQKHSIKTAPVVMHSKCFT